jgi:hypothetical protein
MDQLPEWKNISKWLPIRGKWSLDALSQTYIEPETAQWPHGICISDALFPEGEISIVVQPDERRDGRILLGYRNPDDDYVLIGLGGYGNAYTLSFYDSKTGWRPLIGAGRGEDITPGKNYGLHVRVRGQRIALDVDGVPVFDFVMPMPLPFGQVGIFSWGQNINNHGVRFSEPMVRADAELARGEAFVVMQFSDFEELYSDVIKPVTESFGLKAYRADEVFGPTIIMEDVIRGIEGSQIVIAEITPPNENVFYEVGYAHALKKPTILLAEKSKKLPFDLSGRRCIFYENSIGGKQRVEQNLRHHLEEVLKQ